MQTTHLRKIPLLENYTKNSDGVIYQIKRDKFHYDYEYIDKTYNLLTLRQQISYLRLGYILGAIHSKMESLLDVGYGNGDFLHTAHKIIPNCYGYDIPPSYPLQGIPIVESMYNQYYDVVTFFDSLEHFDNIYDIKNLQCQFIVVSLPECHYVNDEWFAKWKHRKENEHLWHFNLQSLIQFMKNIGFEYICHAHVEDIVRTRYDNNLPNILTGVFRHV